MTQEDTIQAREIWVADKFSFKSGVTPTAAQTGWSVTNKTSDRTFDCNVNDTLVTSDVLGTLIDDLIAKGILSS